MPTAGESPGKGLYICKNCGQSVGIDNDRYPLPLCPKCQGSEYSKVSGTR